MRIKHFATKVVDFFPQLIIFWSHAKFSTSLRAIAKQSLIQSRKVDCFGRSFLAKTASNKFCVTPVIFCFTVFLFSCLGKPGKSESVKFQQYYVQGEQLYIKNCSNCHQKSGAGLGLLYPPINVSNFMEKNPEKVFCLMKYGISGEMEVNGRIYNKPMPGVPSLTELEIAEISTYIFNTWDHSKGIIETNEVTQAISHCNN